MQMALITVFVGIALLAAGRKLFWLFVGVVGFALGYNLALQVSNQYLHGGGQTGVLVFAAVLAVAGALLAVFVEKLAIGGAGFLLGGYLAVQMIGHPEAGINLPQAVLFLLGGIVGALLVALVFNWALVILTSLTGAFLILSDLPLRDTLATVVFVALAVVGMAVQLGVTRRLRLVNGRRS